MDIDNDCEICETLNNKMKWHLKEAAALRRAIKSHDKGHP
jgi:hypothetical protein